MNEMSLGARLFALAIIIGIIAVTASFPMLKEKFLSSKKANKKE